MAQFEIQCVESELEGLRNHYGKFTIEPLEKGQGITLGNSLRRVILSDLSGYSIVSVTIAGVNHEFSTIPGVVEDVVEIILNIKQIRLKKLVPEDEFDGDKIYMTISGKNSCSKHRTRGAIALGLSCGKTGQVAWKSNWPSS